MKMTVWFVSRGGSGSQFDEGKDRPLAEAAPGKGESAAKLLSPA